MSKFLVGQWCSWPSLDWSAVPCSFWNVWVARWATVGLGAHVCPRPGIPLNKPVANRVLSVGEANDFRSPAASFSRFSELLFIKDRRGHHGPGETDERLGLAFPLRGFSLGLICKGTPSAGREADLESTSSRLSGLVPEPSSCPCTATLGRGVMRREKTSGSPQVVPQGKKTSGAIAWISQRKPFSQEAEGGGGETLRAGP